MAPATISDTFVSHDLQGDPNKWIFMARADCPSGCLAFHINTAQLGNGVWITTPLASPEVDRWYHVALVRLGDTYSFFLDGAEVGSAVDPTPIPNSSKPLTLAQSEQGNYMDGSLDEVAIYHRALSAEEIQAIATAGPLGKCDLVDCNANGVEDALDACQGTSPDANVNGIPDECESVSYCTAGISASGCSATLSTIGLPSATAPSGFFVAAMDLEGAKSGLIFFGVNGQQAAPWGGLSLRSSTR